MSFIVFSTGDVQAIRCGYLYSIGVVYVRVLCWRYINDECQAMRTSGSGEALEEMQINPSRLLDSQQFTSALFLSDRHITRYTKYGKGSSIIIIIFTSVQTVHFFGPPPPVQM